MTTVEPVIGHLLSQNIETILDGLHKIQKYVTVDDTFSESFMQNGNAISALKSVLRKPECYVTTMQAMCALLDSNWMESISRVITKNKSTTKRICEAEVGTCLQIGNTPKINIVGDSRKSQSDKLVSKQMTFATPAISTKRLASNALCIRFIRDMCHGDLFALMKKALSSSSDDHVGDVIATLHFCTLVTQFSAKLILTKFNNTIPLHLACFRSQLSYRQRRIRVARLQFVLQLIRSAPEKKTSAFSNSSFSAINKNAVANNFSLDALVNSFGTNMITSHSTHNSTSMTAANEYDGMMNNTFAPSTSHHNNLITIHGVLTHLLEDAAVLLQESTEEEQNVYYSSSVLELIEQKLITSPVLSSAQKRSILLGQRHIIRLLVKALDLPAIADKAFSVLQSIVIHLHESPCDYSSTRLDVADEQNGGMPNYLLFFILRHLRPTASYRASRLMIAILRRAPDLIRPFFIRISGHLAEEGHYHHSSNGNINNESRHSPIAPLTSRVATLNVLTRIALCPLPFHLLSRKVTLETLAAKSNTFYSMSARDVVDEICPIWLGEYIHKIINNSHNLLFLCFALQLTYATLQRAKAVLQIVSEIESNQYNSQHPQHSTFNISKVNASTKDKQRCDEMDAEFDILLDNNNKNGDNVKHAHSESDAQVFILQVHTHLLNSLPRREEFWHRMTQQLHPMLLEHVQHLQRQEKKKEQHEESQQHHNHGSIIMSEDDNRHNSKVKLYSGQTKQDEEDMFAWPRLEFVLQQMWLVMYEYSEIFQLRVSWLSAVPSFTPLLRASLDPIMDALCNNNNNDLLSSWSANSIAALCTLLVSSFTQNVSMVKMHHITMMNKSGSRGLITEWPLLLSLLLWAVRHRRNIFNEDINVMMIEVQNKNIIDNNKNKQLKSSTLISVHMEQNALAWIAKLLQWCVHGVTVQFACSFSEALLWINILDEHDLPCFLHVLNSLLQRSLSKAATRVAEEMMQSEYGVIVHAAESFVERTREKQNADLIKSDETTNNNNNNNTKINGHGHINTIVKEDNHKYMPRQLWMENLQNNLSHFTHTITQVKAKWPMREKLTAAFLSKCLYSSLCDTVHSTRVENDSNENEMIISPVVISTHSKVRSVTGNMNNTNQVTEHDVHHNDKEKDDDDKGRKVSLIQYLLTLCRTKRTPFPLVSSSICDGNADSVNEETSNEENHNNMEMALQTLSTALQNDLVPSAAKDTHTNNLVKIINILEDIPRCKWTSNAFLLWQLAARLLRLQEEQFHEDSKQIHSNMSMKIKLVELVLIVLDKMTAELTDDHIASATTTAEIALSVISGECAQQYIWQSENETIKAGKDVVLLICLRILLSVDMSILLKATSKSKKSDNPHKNKNEMELVSEKETDQTAFASVALEGLQHILSSLASHQLLFYSGTLSTVDRLRYASLLCIHYLQEKLQTFTKDVITNDNEHFDNDNVDNNSSEVESEDEDEDGSSDGSNNDEKDNIKKSKVSHFTNASKETKPRLHVYTSATVPDAIAQNRFNISGMFTHTHIENSNNIRKKSDNTNPLFTANVEVEVLSYLLDTYTEVELMEMSLTWPARLDNNIVCYNTYSTTEQTFHSDNDCEKDDYDDQSMLLLRSIFPEFSSPVDFVMRNVQNKNSFISDIDDDNDDGNSNTTLDPRFFIPLLHCVFSLPTDALESHSLSMKYVGARTLCLLLRSLSFTSAPLRSMAVSCLNCSHAFPAGPYKLIITFTKMKMCALVHKNTRELISNKHTKRTTASHKGKLYNTKKQTEIVTKVPRLAAPLSTFLILCIKPLAFYGHPLHHHLMQFFIHTHHALSTPIPFAHWLCAFPLGVITHELMSKQQEKWYKMNSSQITSASNTNTFTNSHYQRFNGKNKLQKHPSYKYKERNGGVLQASAEAMAHELRQSAPLHILFIVSILQYGCVTNGDAALIIQEGCVQSICHLITLISSSEELRVSLVEVLHTLCSNSTSITFQFALEGHLLIWVMSFLFQLTREFGVGHDIVYHSEKTLLHDNTTINGDNIGSNNTNMNMLSTSSRYGDALFTRTLELLLKLCQILTFAKNKLQSKHFSFVQGSHALGFMEAHSDTMDITLQQIFVQVRQLHQILNRVNVTAKHTIDLVEEILLLEHVHMHRQPTSHHERNNRQIKQHQHSQSRVKSVKYKQELHTRYNSQYNNINKRTRSSSRSNKNRNSNMDGKRDKSTVIKYNKNVNRENMNKRHKVQ